MDNKQKPSRLMFFQEHDFKGIGVPYLPEMLKWPFFGARGPINEGPLLTIHRRAIEGLAEFTRIFSFKASMSLEADPVNKRFVFSHRTWAEIYLNDNCVLVFSHDTRHNNCAFNCLSQWPELHTIGGYTDKDWENLEKELSLWNSDKWADFFYERIYRKYEFLMRKAQAKKRDFLDLEERAYQLLVALGE